VYVHVDDYVCQCWSKGIFEQKTGLNFSPIFQKPCVVWRPLTVCVLLRRARGLASKTHIYGGRRVVALPSTRLSPDDLDWRSGWEVTASASLQSTSGKDTRDLRALREVVPSAECNEV
jgi:hypothetical protein